jgi:anti-anti-sigma factor
MGDAETGARRYGRKHRVMVDLVELDGPARLLQARGRINVLTADLFEAHARLAFAGTDHDVIIDASEVTYLSTAGLRAFLRLWRDLQEKGRDLHVCALRPYIREVFQIIGFDQLIPIHADTAAALAAVVDRIQSRP